MDVESVAEELYGLPVEEFTASRDEQAATARKVGDRDLAAAIKKLSRPTTAAWLANLLVRERTQQIDELLELGAAMREAQAGLAADQMRALATQRRQIVSALGREAVSLANERGNRVSRAIREEMEGTLEAALADPDAGEALRSGRLTSSLRYTGLGSVDIAGVVAAPRPAANVGSTRKSARAAEPSTAPDGAEAERKRFERVEAAEHKLDEARTEAADAKRARDEKERVVREVQERVDGLRRQLDELEQQMQRLRGEEKFATKNLHEAERAKRSSADAYRRAKDSVAKAEGALRAMTRQKG